MAGHDDLLAELPAPNPDEPFSLRQDIADELRDHLECAVRRESLQSSQPEVVKARVLDRFGNPQKIARKLWLDAMKEILMMQKLTLALVSLVAVASLAACGLMWSLAHDFQAASTELLTQSREANAELLTQNHEMMQQLTALANRPTSPPSALDWNPLKVRVVKNDGEKSPAPGFQVALTGIVANPVKKTTDEHGVADFGLVKPGEYGCTIQTPWGDSGWTNILVSPGTSHLEEVVCPAGPPEAVSVEPVVDWPDEFRDLPVAVVVQLLPVGHRKIEGVDWSNNYSWSLLIRPDGRFAVYTLKFSPSPSAMVGPFGTPELFEKTFPWHGQKLYLHDVLVVPLPKDADFPANNEYLPVLSGGPGDLQIYQSYSWFKDIIPQRNTQEKTIVLAGKDPQSLAIALDETEILMTRAALTKSQFPDLPAIHVQVGSLLFLIMDNDGNGELIAEEIPTKGFVPEDWVKEPPVKFETFVTRYVALQAPPEGTEPIRNRFGGAGRGGAAGREGASRGGANQGN